MSTPLIRSIMVGFLCWHTHDAAIVETPTLREPGIAPNPFHILSPVGDSRASEFPVGGGKYQWILAVVCDGSGLVRFGVDVGTSVGQIQATTFSPFTEVDVYNPAGGPCNYNPADALNVYDFMLFLNEKPDWNGDGFYDSNDLVEFMEMCGG